MIHMRQTFITAKYIDHAFTETVNGPLYVPILGRLFPRLWGDRREMRRTRYLVYTDEGCFEVSQSEYGSVSIGDAFDPNCSSRS